MYDEDEDDDCGQPIKLVRRATQAFVTKQFATSGTPQGQPSQNNQDLEIHSFVTEPASVRVSLGMTVNLGNYESARIDVSLTVPCYKEEVEDAFEYAREWVEARTLKEVNAAKKVASGRSDPF